MTLKDYSFPGSCCFAGLRMIEAIYICNDDHFRTLPSLP